MYIAEKHVVLLISLGLLLGTSACGKGRPTIQGQMSYAPEVPAPIARHSEAVVHVDMNASVQIIQLAPGVQYRAWTFNGRVPAPMIRAREGDTLEVAVTNSDPTGHPHNLDFHAVIGTGGGAMVTTVIPGERRVGIFKLRHPGLFLYHCGTPPVMDHIANGMYGLILVEPKEGLSHADREYYVVQGEFYPGEPTPGSNVLELSHEAGLRETPQYIVFNGNTVSLMGNRALQAKTGERLRVFFGNAGPNKMASFHIIGEVFDRVFRDGSLADPPAHSIQTAVVPPGSAAVVEFKADVPGSYTIVDHAIFRTERGAAGQLNVEGPPRPDLYDGK